MNTFDLKKLLEENSYCGRGIVIGKSPDGKNALFAYFTMGRSENSRNRIFEKTADGIIIKPFDESRLSDPSLVIYSPVREIDNNIIVTNGDQTDTIYDFLKSRSTFEEALNTRCFEPDAPNYTPRISGIIEKNNNTFTYRLSILKSADEDGTACSRYFFNYAPLNGIGHFIHTYAHDGDPIPSFEGEPERIALPDCDIDCFTNMLWSALNDDNKVSLYVTYLSLESGECETRIKNKLA